MSNTKRKLSKRKRVLTELNRLDEHASKLLFVHYSCESFYDLVDTGRSARITSIAARYFETGQSVSFSIHTTAEKENKLDSIESHYDELEKIMLEDFFDFVCRHDNYYWIHWNMRDISYGFQAINHRFEVLGGTPKIIADDKKFDLADKLKVVFGSSYIGHPRFEMLIKMNEISDKDFLKGKEEADAFENREYIKLHHSTLRKVNVMHEIFDKVLDKNLKTNSKKREVYGLSLQGRYEMVREHWLFNLFLLVLGGIISQVITWLWK
ncbi:hypothetical protein [Sporosarcina koreensis]|uniref:hypothetical protein n=1 Tax=Sporosarcina koreensis TaxID=334735 RepID=UPI00058B2C7B|nr:hypothetical protein [Sporosarcina koreensis]